MYPASFAYHRATGLTHALDLLGRHPGAKLLAGGHSLIPMMKLRMAQPATVVDIGRIAELRGIAETEGGARIGALTPHSELAGSPLLARVCPLLAEAAGQIGDPQVRNRGTIGGNLVHADPASDLPGVLVALEASLELTSTRGLRTVAAADFFVDLMTSDTGADEILTAISVPGRGERTGSAYRKVEHPASGYAVCGAAAVIELGSDGRCQRARLVFNGVTATPHVAETSTLVGRAPDRAALAQVADAIALSDPLGDLHASGEYRQQLARVEGRRALATATERAGA